MALVNRKDVTSIIFCSVLLQKDQLLCMLRSLRTQSLQSLWKFSCHLLLKLLNTGHSDSFLDQVNNYLTYPELYFNVVLHRHQPFPEAAPRAAEVACVS